MTCPDCASERGSRLRAERELNEAALATSQRLITLAESLARAERERDEARALTRDAYDTLTSVPISTHPPERQPILALVRRLRAALSSPAVTAEGKKLGEEEGGA